MATTMASPQQQQQIEVGVKRERDEEQDQKRQRVEATPVAVVSAPSADIGSLAGASYQPAVPKTAVVNAANDEQDQVFLHEDVKWEVETATDTQTPNLVYGDFKDKPSGIRSMNVNIINDRGNKQEIIVQHDNASLCFEPKLSKFGKIEATLRLDDTRPDIISFCKRADKRNLAEIMKRVGFAFAKPNDQKPENVIANYVGLEILGKFKNPTKNSMGVSTNTPEDERWHSSQRIGIPFNKNNGQPRIPLTNLAGENVHRLTDFQKWMRVNCKACYYEVWVSGGGSGMKGHAKCMQLIPRRDPMAERCLSDANMDRLRTHQRVWGNDGRLLHQDQVVEVVKAVPTSSGGPDYAASDGMDTGGGDAANAEEETAFLNKFLEGDNN